ncbi:hypothetical protein CTRI78_v009524 [Colletotrichum trifolii]|uniref:Zn(2)-C6 fungal-type domain-containing protein n=1 Tax=Colletotrichum trifolii TaxID=5466 RepID=A0A4R8QWF7_COLTR|nr:hypothetical protein CTRI78_v009524 [Colletotrichum trifolii]
MDTAASGRRRSTASSVGPEGRPRRVRPSRARGLRTSTGWRRRIKCDEGKPKCLQCCKSDRECQYAQAPASEEHPSSQSHARHRSGSTVSNATTSTTARGHVQGQGPVRGSPRESSGHLPAADEGTAGPSSSPVSASRPRPRPGLATDSGVVTSPTAQDASSTARPVDFATPYVAPFNPADTCGPLDDASLQQQQQQQQANVSDEAAAAAAAAADLGFSPLALSHTSLLNISPFEWYDLLAQDAISNLQRLNNSLSTAGGTRWAFDESTLSRRQSPIPEPPPGGHHAEQQQQQQQQQRVVFGNGDGAGDGDGDGAGAAEDASFVPPWNTTHNIELSPSDLIYFRYYVDVVGPILDLFDPERHFSNAVPHLAVRNDGLLKSILAVAARHKSLATAAPHCRDSSATPRPPTNASSSPGTDTSCCQGGTLAELEPARMATQYYYETLQYLSHTLLYPSYANSHEILATAIMISTYEMFDANGPSNSADWERHLRGAFWIQRSQENNGESVDGLRRAVWWAWLRQDIWAAFRSGRRTLTIFQPQRMLRDLTPDELVNRILFVAAKCVEYAAHDDASSAQDLRQRMNHGSRLLRTLDEWREALPASFAPISAGFGPRRVGGSGSSSSAAEPSGASRHSPASPAVQQQQQHLGQNPSFSPSQHTTASASASASTPAAAAAAAAAAAGANIFEPIWFHPPSHAGAMQMYHFARSVVLLAQPSTGGLGAYRRRQKLLNESLHTVCGIANACQDNDFAMAFLNVQVVFAVGQCAQMREKQAEMLEILRKSVAISRFPAKGLTEELDKIWREGF